MTDPLISDFSQAAAGGLAETACTVSMLDRVAEAVLTPRELFALRWRFGVAGRTPLSLADLGATMGVSRTRASQLVSRALREMRWALRDVRGPWARSRLSRRDVRAAMSDTGRRAWVGRV